MKRDLMKHLPRYWHSVEEMKVIQDILGEKLSFLQERQQDVAKQFFIETATWGLALWERELGIPQSTKPDDLRRQIILAKLRGAGTTTIRAIENVAKAFENEGVKVVEHNEEYYFELDFIGKNMQIQNLGELETIIEEIKPAHLGFRLNRYIKADNIFLGTALVMGEEATVYPYQITEVESKAQLHIPVSLMGSAETIEVRPKP